MTHAEVVAAYQDVLTLTGDPAEDTATPMQRYDPSVAVVIGSSTGNDLEELISGYYFQIDQTRAMQDDDMLNPAFLWVDLGQELWGEIDGKAGKSCASCHAAESGFADPNSQLGTSQGAVSGVFLFDSNF